MVGSYCCSVDFDSIFYDEEQNSVARVQKKKKTLIIKLEVQVVGKAWKAIKQHLICMLMKLIDQRTLFFISTIEKTNLRRTNSIGV